MCSTIHPPSGAKWAVLLVCCLGLKGCREFPSPTDPPGVLRLAGSPEEIGRRHGELLADRIHIMLREYIGDVLEGERLRPAEQAQVRTMKPALPEWYLRELRACARAAQVDEDVLLYAQCEGDLRSLPKCTSYVAFGERTADGSMEIGRSFDYWGLESTEQCTLVFAVIPRPGAGYAFVSVGWAGILGGWTFLNEKGLFVACNLGGFWKKNPQGVPALILLRIMAQQAATVEAAIETLRKTPRMRGTALVLGHPGVPAANIPPDAAVVLYDAERVEVQKHDRGWAFHSSVGTDPAQLLEILRQPNRSPTAAIQSAGNYITLHSVAIRPQSHTMWVAHGRRTCAHLGSYVQYDLSSLLARPEGMFPSLERHLFPPRITQQELAHVLVSPESSRL